MQKCMLYHALQCLRTPAPQPGGGIYCDRLKYNVLKKTHNFYLFFSSILSNTYKIMFNLLKES